MGGVLIDDHQPITGLREDIVFMHLSSRRTKRMLAIDGSVFGAWSNPR
jgi:hypothetical protein